MRNEEKNIDRLLEKLKIKSPLTQKNIKEIKRRKRKSLVKIFKEAKQYNPVFGAILFIFFMFKRIGITISFLQSATIMVCVSIFVPTVLVASLYIGVKMYLDDKTEIKIENKEVSETINIQKKEKPVKVKPVIKPETKPIKKFKKFIIFNSFETNNVNNDVILKLSNNFKKRLRNLRGNENILSEATNTENNYYLFGSIEKIENKYVLSIRLVDKKSGMIDFLDTTQVNSMNELKGKIQQLALQISQRLE